MIETARISNSQFAGSFVTVDQPLTPRYQRPLKAEIFARPSLALGSLATPRESVNSGTTLGYSRERLATASPVLVVSFDRTCFQ